jgi:RimJ/RimL family protein N-acetyltransferase
MNSRAQLRTDRILLRPWCQSDLDPLAALIADPRVMLDLPGPLPRSNSDALVERSRAHFRQHGFGLWAVEVPGVAPFIGLAGLWHVATDAPVAPCVELRWHLAPAHWGLGYATEASAGLLTFAFAHAHLDEVVGFTASENQRARRVMDKVGMQREPTRDLVDPCLPAHHRFRQQLLYRIDARSWLRRRLPRSVVAHVRQAQVAPDPAALLAVAHPDLDLRIVIGSPADGAAANKG